MGHLEDNVRIGIRGGALETGSSAIAEYDRSVFAHSLGDLINFVFSSTLALPPVHLNVGFYDQRITLQWVQKVSAFGGDPKKVAVLPACALLTTLPPVPFSQSASSGPELDRLPFPTGTNADDDWLFMDRAVIAWDAF